MQETAGFIPLGCGMKKHGHKEHIEHKNRAKMACSDGKETCFPVFHVFLIKS